MFLKLYEDSVILLSASYCIASKNRSLLLLAPLVTNHFRKKKLNRNINYNDYNNYNDCMVSYAIHDKFDLS